MVITWQLHGSYLSVTVQLHCSNLTVTVYSSNKAITVFSSNLSCGSYMALQYFSVTWLYLAVTWLYLAVT